MRNANVAKFKAPWASISKAFKGF